MKKVFSLVLIIVCFLFPYSAINGSWKFELATGLTLLLSAWGWGRQWIDQTGLRISTRELMECFLLSLFVYQFGSLAIPFLAAKKGIAFILFPDWGWRVAPVFQSFNEEIVLRALLLGCLVKFFKKWQYASVFAAFGFTFLHWVLYRFNFIHELVELVPFALINLTLFGFICNDLFFRSGHIGYGAALHIGWNLTRFGGEFRIDDQRILEGHTFNFIEASPLLTCSLLALYLILRYWIHFKNVKCL